MPDDKLYVSLSAARSYQRCQQQYSYGYVDRLQRREKAPAPELGIIIHEYLEYYYTGLALGKPALEAHGEALTRMHAENDERIEQAAGIAVMGGADDAATVLLDLTAKCDRICQRYFAAHGLADANRYEVIKVEERLSSEILPGIISNGVVDLVTRDRTNGRVHIWEHKSVTTEPPTGVRLFDLQTPLYISQLDVEIDAVNWNYLRTKEPTVPALLKKGTLSKDKSCDTTWECYLDAVKANNLNPVDYEDMRDLFGSRELNIFFPRYEQVVVTDEIILEDYKETAREIWRARKRWREGKARPIRALNRDCEFFCQFKMLCHTVLTGGDEADMIALRYTTSRRN